MTMAGTRVHAFADDALAEDDAVGLVARMRDGQVSAAEIVDAAVARAELVQPALHGLCYQAFDRARAEARAPRPGYFSGVPTVVKDNVDVAGMPTQHGALAWVARTAKQDGDVARVLLGTGLVPLGKTQLSEFGFNASAEFPDDDPVHNPWHTDDGGGSIRIPASCCGLVGLKPTRGRTPSDKMMREMPVRIVADGVVTRSVRDAAVFHREAEKIYRNLELPPIGDIRGPAQRRLRVALVTQSVASRATDPECIDAVENVANLLEREGHHVELAQAPIPDSFVADFRLYWAMLAGYMNGTGRFTVDRAYDMSRTDNLTRGLAREFRRKAYRLPMAISRLRASQRTSRRFFEQ